MSARAWRHWAEALALAVSPAAAYFVLRIRLMPIADLNDPAMHTTYMIDPQSIFLRYSAAFESSQRLREGARVGLLLPGRISYLLFGGLPGFVVFRYVLALVAVVPTYLLLRRLFGRAAGAVGVIVIISSPVILTAWGTDFPNSATISYLIAGLACLAMPSAHRRVLWLAGSAAFFTVAVWTFASSTVLIVATVAAYAVIRWRRDRENVLRDIEIVGGVAIAVTAVLAVGSFVLLGQFDFILPTFKSVIYLAHRSNVVLNHSAGPGVGAVFVVPSGAPRGRGTLVRRIRPASRTYPHATADRRRRMHVPARARGAAAVLGWRADPRGALLLVPPVGRRERDARDGSRPARPPDARSAPVRMGGPRASRRSAACVRDRPARPSVRLGALRPRDARDHRRHRGRGRPIAARHPRNSRRCLRPARHSP